MDVEPEHVDSAFEGVGDQLQRLRRRQAELRPVVTCADRLVRIRVDTERDPDESALARRPRQRARPRRARRAPRPWRPTQAACARNAVSLLLPWTTSSSPVRPAARANASSPAEATSAPTPSSRSTRRSGDVRQRLRPERDEAFADRRSQRARTAPERLLAKHDERRPELLGESHGGHPAERELTALDGGRVWEQLQHSCDSACYD